ncbi:hypothetical protein E1263_35485 [Kribbella antibiotica]|uniref:Uncharacterized protein n=1 Tax=Kribbella antibiotica TaxID=190195 RepID=A0A4R4YS25_9ACTN|nr:hypothetical protein [Kribbella antibiotica]TDD46999.1 hypothetical protein E1263_35485 [Kribbella antibiotica]
MRELLNRRTDQPLPPGVHDKLRTELLDAIEENQPRQARRVLVPVAAAAAVLAVAAGLAVAVPALKKDNPGTPVAGGGELVVRDLSAADTATLQAQCQAEADRLTVKQLPQPFRSYKAVRAFEFVNVNDPKVVKTWLIAKGKPDTWQDGVPPIVEEKQGYWLCSRTAGGAISESSLRHPVVGEVSEEVRSIARNAGTFAGTVTRVTVQPKGLPERDAYLFNGFWFAPTVGRVGWGPHYDDDDPNRWDFVYRAYDARGRKIYDSAKPTEPNCTAQMWVLGKDGKKRPANPDAKPNPPYCLTYKWPSR